ncbi:TadE/TadG family type IV pilus assembly protein [Gellertiella hungarica]|uniref:Flp pilus assembly protein TadG/uncharacterized protein YegL n=1 Tax=Gellertiella hungarica TaxID=1572859 RepID=A0A7W6J6N5_9HYPH|nr:TadE/TadG family type IV pilus assembly protein [Gellertiella hungarica]MBB4065801.1 Flp pilus assembly protein TadG/uncharacterized protein YegL [Gellertiella hungarica]
MLKSRDGNFAVTTAILIPMLLMAGGMALDITSMSRTREQLQNAVDSAALGAASAMVNNGLSASAAQLLAQNFIKGHMAGSGSTVELQNLGTPTVSITQTAPTSQSKVYTVKVTSTYNVPLSGIQVLLGYTHARVTAVGSAQSEIETKNPISMYLALDRSGSMEWVTTTVDTSQSACNNYYEANWPNPTWQSPCYVKKIASLKSAVKALADVFDGNDPTKEYVRMGAVSYSNVANAPAPLNWGTTDARNYTNALTASGGTNSTDAIKTAYNALNAASETQAHMGKSGIAPQKFILFMTDGANDNTNNDASTRQWCDTAKTAGIQIYSVAFVAPDRGKQLLSYCSSGTSYYFEASNVNQLISAFQSIGKKTSKLSNRLTQ